MQAIYPLVDTLLECTVNASDAHSNFGDLVGCVDCIVFPESNMIQVKAQHNQILGSIQLNIGKFRTTIHISHHGFFSRVTWNHLLKVSTQHMDVFLAKMEW